MKAAFDYLARVVMLVLAGLVTLSIIGAIASIPSGSIGTRIGFERSDPMTPSSTMKEEPASLITGEPGNISETGSTTMIERVPAIPKEREPAEWLEAITYALIALVGLVALGCLLLWRIANSLSSLSLQGRGLRSLSDEGA